MTTLIRTRIEGPGWHGSGQRGYFLLWRGSPIIRAGTTISEDNPEVRTKVMGNDDESSQLGFPRTSNPLCFLPNFNPKLLPNFIPESLVQSLPVSHDG